MRTAILTFAASLACLVVGQSDELHIEVTLSVVRSRKTRSGDTISVNYRGSFTNGTEFDSSYGPDSDGPFSFHLGAGEVIAGFDQGLEGMCIGEKRRLTIPPRLGYGDRDVGPIPTNSTLVFDTELMGIAGVLTPANITTQPISTATQTSSMCT